MSRIWPVDVKEEYPVIVAVAVTEHLTTEETTFLLALRHMTDGEPGAEYGLIEEDRGLKAQATAMARLLRKSLKEAREHLREGNWK